MSVNSPRAVSTCQKIAEVLFLDGAMIAYGGMGRVRVDPLSALLRDVRGLLPRRLAPPGSGAPWMLVMRPRLSNPARVMPVRKSADLQVLDPPEVKQSELMTRLAEEDNQRWNDSLSLFRMRYALASQCVARVVIGGRVHGFFGRFPSVAESLMIAIAMGQPVYVAGGFGGAAAWVGQLLGLGDGWSGIPPGFARDPLAVEKWTGREHRFRPPPHHTDLPLGRADLIDFFMCHAFSDPRWRNNGLNARENGQLFQSTNPSEIADLVRHGLRRRFS